MHHSSIFRLFLADRNLRHWDDQDGMVYLGCRGHCQTTFTMIKGLDTSELVESLNLDEVPGETAPLLLIGKLKGEYGGYPNRGPRLRAGATSRQEEVRKKIIPYLSLHQGQSRFGSALILSFRRLAF